VRFIFEKQNQHSMRKFLVTLALSITAFIAFCQEDSLLRSFKFRIDNFRAVNFNIAGGKFNNNKATTGDDKYSSSSAGFGIYYYTLKSTDKTLFTSSANLNSSFSASKTDNSIEVNKYSSFSGASGYSALNKWFSTNKFTELGTTVSGNYYINKNIVSNNPIVAKNGQSQYSIAINTGIGKGRLENVTDMQNALWLYKELNTVKSLSRPLSSGELNELGRAITKGNNTRVLDFRKKTQFILKTVDDYLQQKNLIPKTDITYFTSLNDILFFAFNNLRFAGTEKYIRLTPAISGGNNNQTQHSNTDKFEHRFSSKSVALSSGFGKYIPVNLNHQNNYGASLKLSYFSTDSKDKYFTSGVITSEIKGNAAVKQAAINLFFQHAIYPNTRTAINFDIQSEAGYQDTDQQSTFYGTATLSGSFNYFISYRTRLSCKVGASYQKNVYNIGQYLELRPETIQLYANAGIEINL